MRGWEKVPHDPSCSESCRLVQGSQCFVGEILPEQPVERMHKKRPCKQRRLQPLQCGTLLEVREWAQDASTRVVPQRA